MTNDLRKQLFTTNYMHVHGRSPLTQCCLYHAACDNWIGVQVRNCLSQQWCRWNSHHLLIWM